MRFRYEAFDKLARVTGGSLEAASQEDAAAKLRLAGLFVQKIEQMAETRMETVLPGAAEKVEQKPAAKATDEDAEIPQSSSWQDELSKEILAISRVLRHLDIIQYSDGVGKKTREILTGDGLVRIGELAIAAAVARAARKA